MPNININNGEEIKNYKIIKLVNVKRLINLELFFILLFSIISKDYYGFMITKMQSS